MTYDQWKDPTDCSPDDDNDWLSLVEVFEEWEDRKTIASRKEAK